MLLSIHSLNKIIRAIFSYNQQACYAFLMLVSRPSIHYHFSDKAVDICQAIDTYPIQKTITRPIGHLIKPFVRQSEQIIESHSA